MTNARNKIPQDLTLLAGRVRDDVRRAHQSRVSRRSQEPRRQALLETQRALVNCANYCHPYGPPPSWYEGDRRRELLIASHERFGSRYNWRQGFAGEVLDHEDVGFCQRFANEAFCSRWVRYYWMPTVPLVLRDLGMRRVEAFDPDYDLLRITRSLYVDLLRDSEGSSVPAADPIVKRLAQLRSGELDGCAHGLHLYFECLADLLQVEEEVVRDPAEFVEEDPAWAQLGARERTRQVVRDDVEIELEYPGDGLVIVRRIDRDKVVDEVEIRGRSLARCFRIVTRRPGEHQTWRQVHKAWAWEGGGDELSSMPLKERTLQDYGTRIRRSLGPLAYLWEQTGAGVTWAATSKVSPV